MTDHPLILTGGPVILDPNAGIFQPLTGSAVLQVSADQLRNGESPYHGELQYLGLLQELVDKHEENPLPRDDRTGTGTYSVFGRQMRFNLEDSFPLLTTKRVFWRGVVGELLWMLSGSTSAKPLQEQDIHIWDEWCDEQCQLGPVYGQQWRAWQTQRREYSGDLTGTGTQPVVIDQISTVIKNLIEKPNDRGHVVSAWNVADLQDMRLRPCHALFQFYVDNGKLSLQLYQRSADIFLGVPFNIASYALLTHLIAREVGLGVGEFIHTFGDLHLYSNHVEQAKAQLVRNPKPFPTVEILGDKDIFDLKFDDIKLDGYEPHPAIKAEVSV
jgi:thymidylate synthase